MMHNILGISLFGSIAIGIAVISVFLWVWALVDCIGSKKESSEKLIWILIIIFLNVIGAIIYLAFNTGNKGKDEESSKAGVSAKKESGRKRLYRSRKDAVLGGVCGGIADYFNTDPTFIRLALVLLFFINSSTLLAYIIAWIIIPQESVQKKSKAEAAKESKKNSSWVWVLIILGIIGLLFLFTMFFGWLSYMSPSHVIRDDVFINEEGIKVGRIEISPEGIVYDRIDRVREGLESRIINDYNYVAHNGYGLEYLGIRMAERKRCAEYAGQDAHLKQNCYELRYLFYIDTDRLPEQVYGFEVSALTLDYDILDIEYKELVRD